ncbi:MAG: hypothetical protein Q8R02_01435, partial [Hyphomonadaceae bacterium]|nr:hypothetical protein [Hyphomonadaceae bacterium]
MPSRSIAVACALLASPSAFAQQPAAYEPPRTVDGRPDLQGVWGATFLTPMERPKDIKELVLTDEQARDLGAKWNQETPDLIDPDFFLQNISELASVKGTMRSSLLVKPEDGQMPFTEKGVKLAERASALEEFAFDNPEERPTYERCIAGQGQAPIRQIPAFIPNLIVQTPASIALITEDVGSLRIIHMDGRRPPPDVIRTYEGWSAGHWDGDTLVVVT